jgi:hypothetical protein
VGEGGNAVQILISLALILFVMIALVVGLTLGGMALAGSAGKAFDEGPMRSGFVPRVAFILLWAMVFGVSLGLIGAG